MKVTMTKLCINGLVSGNLERGRLQQSAQLIPADSIWADGASGLPRQWAPQLTAMRPRFRTGLGSIFAAPSAFWGPPATAASSSRTSAGWITRCELGWQPSFGATGQAGLVGLEVSDPFLWWNLGWCCTSLLQCSLFSTVKFKAAARASVPSLLFRPHDRRLGLDPSHDLPHPAGQSSLDEEWVDCVVAVGSG